MADIKTAMKAGEKDRLAALRLVSAAFKQFEVDNRAEVDDERAVELLTRMGKQRRESIAQYDGAGRGDLADKERFELDIINGFLPEQLDEAAIDAAVAEAIANSGASGMRDMGKVMGLLNASLKGRADMSQVSARVKARLAG
ncbi:MAG: GatB/YqeY domain-containing protein [Gammaproteobacteria bacterium]|nr:GatB/YqeY domain-containing protein [Gammaproteobacteria bacterium]